MTRRPCDIENGLHTSKHKKKTHALNMNPLYFQIRGRSDFSFNELCGVTPVSSERNHRSKWVFFHPVFNEIVLFPQKGKVLVPLSVFFINNHIYSSIFT
jgi:hypothetical protein